MEDTKLKRRKLKSKGQSQGWIRMWKCYLANNHRGKPQTWRSFSLH